jgi:hypothetical protein
MTMDPLFPPEDDPTPFLVNRVGLLHKLLADRRIWQQARAQFGPQSTQSVGWIDTDGEPHRTLLTRDVLAGHTSVLRAVIDDLMRCGPEGQRLVRVIVGDQPQLDPTTDDAPTGESG